MGFLSKYTNIFFDFDGVIKESVTIKSDAFEQIFITFGKKIAKKVRNHHESNGGMSRFDKLPVYIEWSGQIPTQQLINNYSNNFSKLVKQKVIDAPWVAGVIDYIKSNSDRQTFFIVTATPQREIEEILDELNIAHYFCKVIGTPTTKDDAIKIILDEYQIDKEQSVMIGDSNSDYEAAAMNKIPFILRRTDFNKPLQQSLSCSMISDFLDE